MLEKCWVKSESPFSLETEHGNLAQDCTDMINKDHVCTYFTPCAQPIIRQSRLYVTRDVKSSVKKGPVTTGHKAHCCDCTLAIEADQHESISILNNWELVPSDSLWTLFQEIKPQSLRQEIAHMLWSQDSVDPLWRKKNENECFFKSCDAFSVFDHCFKVKSFVFRREPEGRRGREFPSVKTEKIKSRFVPYFLYKTTADVFKFFMSQCSSALYLHWYFLLYPLYLLQ